MSTKRIILISGYARSGKDTLATALLAEFAKANKEAAVTKFAIALKRALQLALNDVGLGHIDVFTEDTAEKEILRPLLVEFGKYCRAKDKDVFVKRTLKDAGELLEQGKDAVMISDCRYLNEAKLVRAFGRENCWQVSRLAIYRQDIGPANDEEAKSIDDLRANDHAEDAGHFPEGDTDGIKAWAKRLVRPLGDAPDWLKEGNKGAPVDPKKVTAYLPHGVPSSWHGPDGKPIFVDKTVPVFGHTHNPTPAPVEEQLKALWEETFALDETIDKASERTDDIAARLISIGLTLERIDARLKRLEVGRG